MFIIIKNPDPNPPDFTSELGRVINTIYNDVASAQNDAQTLASANPGNTYVVFQLVMQGYAVLTPAPLPPVVWTPTV